MTREQAIKKEKEYAERRFNQLLEEVDKIPKDDFEIAILVKIKALDERWRAFCEHLIYLIPEGKDEFMKVAMERAFKAIKIEQ